MYRGKYLLQDNSFTRVIRMITVWVVYVYMTEQLTVCMSVDSALDTSTNTSASRQNLSIQRSKLGVTSIPGLKTTKHNQPNVL